MAYTTVQGGEFSRTASSNTKAYPIVQYQKTSETETRVAYTVRYGIYLTNWTNIANEVTWQYHRAIKDNQNTLTYINSYGTLQTLKSSSLTNGIYIWNEHGCAFTKTTSPQTRYFQSDITGLEITDPENVSWPYYTTDTIHTDAVWTLTIPALNQYTVEFIANGHGTAPSSQTIYYGYKASEPTAPTARGYDFLGWYTDTNYTTKWDFNTMAITGNRKLYAKWQVHTYTITYNPNGGTGNVKRQDKVFTASVNLYTQSQAGYDKIVQTSPIIKYTIASWNTASNGNGNSYTTGQQLDSATLSQDLYLYAIWQPQYIYPTISNLTVIRTKAAASSDTTEYDDGEYLYITFNWTGYSTNGQASSPTYNKPTCKITVDNNYTYTPTLSGTASANSVSFPYKITTQSFSRDLSHTISVELYNSSNTTQRADASITIATAILPIDLYGSGSNVYMGIMHPYVSGQVITIPNLYIDTTGTTTIDTALQTAITNLGWSDVLT